MLFWGLSMIGFGNDKEAISDVAQVSLEDILEMKITATSKRAESIIDAPGVITVISRAEIEGFAAKNLGEVLNRIPGAIFLSANVFADNVVSIRGQSITPYDNHILILVNGRPVRDPVSGGLNQTIHTAFPLDIIDHIEVIRGPGSVLYGSCAFSGVVNIVTASPKENSTSGDITLKGGSWGAFSQNIGLSFKKNDLNWVVGVSHFKDNGPKYEFTDYVGVHDQANWDREPVGIFTNFGYKGFHVNGLFATLLIYSLEGKDNKWDPLNAHDNNRQTTYFIDAGYTLNLGKSLTLDTNLTYNRHSWDQSDNANMTASDVLVEVTAKYRPSEKFNIVAGSILDNDNYSGEHFISDKTTTKNLYLQLDYKVVNFLKIIGGFQFNKLEGIKGNFSPRLGIIANITDKVGVKLLYSKAFRKAYPLETSFNHPVFRGNKDISPELIATYEGQIFYQDEKKQFFLTGFYSKMSDIIIRKWINDPTVIPYGGYLKYFNGGSYQFWGVELEGKASLAKNVLAQGSITYQQNKDEAGIKSVTLHPNFMAKFGLIYSNPTFSFSAYNSYFGNPSPVSLVNPTVSECNKEAEAFNLLSAKATLHLLKLFGGKSAQDLQLSIEADNILDKDIRYPEYTSKGVNTLLPLKGGASVYAGLSFIF